MPQISTIQYSQLSEYFGRIDAEFYKPVSLNADQIIKNQKHQKLGHLVSDGYRVVYESTKILSPEQIDLENDTRFLQATNISSDGLWIEVENIGFVSVRDWDRYPKGRIQHGEVLIEVKGQAEKVTIVQDYMPERTLVTGSVFKLSLKKNTISHEYLFAFFSSHYGKVLRDRTKVNTLIAYVSKPELYRIPIPIPNNEEHTYITNLIKESFNKQKLSKDLYSQATQLLDDALGLKSIEFKKEKSYTASFSEVVSNNRADAEFFDTKFDPYLKAISQYENGTMPLIQTCERVLPNFDSSKEKAKQIIYLEIGDINISDGDFEFKQINTSEAPANAKIVLKGGEVLISMVRPTRGAMAIVPDVLPEKKVVCSGAFYVFKPKDKTKREVIWLFLRLIRNCLEKYCGGTSYPTIEPKYLSFFPIPDFDSELAGKISKLVVSSAGAKKESKELLELAKQEVETLIEKAAQSA